MMNRYYEKSKKKKKIENNMNSFTFETALAMLVDLTPPSESMLRTISVAQFG